MLPDQWQVYYNNIYVYKLGIATVLVIILEASSIHECWQHNWIINNNQLNQTAFPILFSLTYYASLLIHSNMNWKSIRAASTYLILKQHWSSYNWIITLIQFSFPHQYSADIGIVVFKVLPTLSKLRIPVKCYSSCLSVSLHEKSIIKITFMPGTLINQTHVLTDNIMKEYEMKE